MSIVDGLGVSIDDKEPTREIFVGTQYPIRLRSRHHLDDTVSVPNADSVGLPGTGRRRAPRRWSEAEQLDFSSSLADSEG